MQNRIKVWEALDLFASFNARSVPWEPLLDQLGLAEKRNAPFAKLSGGQKQRLYIALALVNDPEIVFLDELTTGLDPHARRAMWDLVRQVRDRGKTVVLTTHFLEEAERLCDRVAVMDRGRIVALDTPEKLIQSIGAENRVVFVLAQPADLRGLSGIGEVSRVEQTGDRVVVYGRNDQTVVEVVKFLSVNRVRFRDLRTEQPTMEDVFLALTGQGNEGLTMKMMRGFWKLTWVEFKLFLREPMALFFTLVFPLMMLFLFGSIYGNKPNPFFGGLGFIDTAVPAYTAMIIATSGLISLSISIASYSEQGILRRFKATTLRPQAILGSQVIQAFLVTLLGMILLVIAGKIVFHLRFPGNPLSVLAGFVLGSLSFFALSFIIASVKPTTRSSQVTAMVLF